MRIQFAIVLCDGDGGDDAHRYGVWYGQTVASIQGPLPLLASIIQFQCPSLGRLVSECRGGSEQKKSLRSMMKVIKLRLNNTRLSLSLGSVFVVATGVTKLSRTKNGEGWHGRLMSGFLMRERKLG